MIRALLVDDEEPARSRLRRMLDCVDDLEVIGEAADGEAAVAAIARQKPDLIFLDIQMPGRTGLEVAAALAPPRPQIIFCTAFDQYAVAAFEHSALDYLLKPLNAGRLGQAVDRVRGTLLKEGRLGREVQDASATQARLLPQAPPEVSGLDYGGVCRTAHGVGGDYYDFLELDNGRLGVAVGDVSGKGLFAGLLVAGLQARVQSIVTTTHDCLPDVMQAVNRVMHSSTDSNRYVTFFFGQYDGASRELNYVNAGHNPPLLLRPRDGGRTYERLELEANGTVIGLLPDARYESDTLKLRSGDILTVYTDGLTEASNREGEEFGVQRLAEFVEHHAGLTADDLRDRTLGEVDRFLDGAPQQDDLTLVVIKVS